MAITTLDQFIAAPSQQLTFLKTASFTSVSGIPFTEFDVAGNPGPGAIDVGNIVAGIVPTDAIAGYPTILPFGGSNTGYIGGVSFGCTVACRLILMDCLFSAGLFNFNSNVTLAGQPSYVSRLPGGSYDNTELWMEAATVFTGNQTIQVTYLDQDGLAGDTGAIATAVAPGARRMLQLPLAAGDTGISRVDNITSSIATVGTFNIHVMRRLWMGRVRATNDGDVHDFLKTGMPQIFADSALRLITQTDSTATGVPELMIEIVNG